MRFSLPSGERGAFSGAYRRVEPPARLAFTLDLLIGRSGVRSSAVSLELRESAAGTELELVHEGSTTPSERDEAAGAWNACLGRLPSVLDAALDRFYERLLEFPRFRSRFGGLWPDLTDAEARLEGKRTLGLMTDSEARLFRHWMEKGYVVLEHAVDTERIDHMLEDLEDAWTKERGGLELEVFGPQGRRFVPIAPAWRGVPHKILDFHGHSAPARDVLFAPALRRFLELLFERSPMAFQSLFFSWGTEQDMHQDTAYVLLRSPMEFVGCWIALEDVRPGSGELQYYEGSHRIPEFLWFGRSRAKPYDYEDEADFLRWMHDKPRELGLPLARFRPKKGDALLWHADLVHGGAERTSDATRLSLVTHFCPSNVDPEWFGTSKHSPRLEHVPGCFYCYRLRGDR